MKEEKVYFESGGVKICGVLALLDYFDQSKKYPLVILCHGTSSSKDNRTNTMLKKRLLEEGIISLSFDFYGHGESEGKFEDVTISKASENILSAIDFVRNLNYVGKIALFGSSFGGVCSVFAASMTKDLTALVLKAPALEMAKSREMKLGLDNIEKWKKEGFLIYTNNDGKEFRLNYSFYEDAISNDAYEAAKNIVISTLIIHGDKDIRVPLEQSKKLVKIIPQAKLEIIEGTNHFFDGPGNFEKVIKLSMNFFKEELK